MKKVLTLMLIMVIPTLSMSGCSFKKCDICGSFGADHSVDAITIWYLCDDCYFDWKDDYETDDEYNSSNENYESAYSVLKISGIHTYTNSSSTICTGTITNNGSKTYKYVEVKGAFKDFKGTVLDTDWTYAVGSEGLAPGESKTFRLSVSKNYSIEECSISIIDYD